MKKLSEWFICPEVRAAVTKMKETVVNDHVKAGKIAERLKKFDTNLVEGWYISRSIKKCRRIRQRAVKEQDKAELLRAVLGVDEPVESPQVRPGAARSISTSNTATGISFTNPRDLYNASVMDLKELQSKVLKEQARYWEDYSENSR